MKVCIILCQTNISCQFVSTLIFSRINGNIHEYGLRIKCYRCFYLKDCRTSKVHVEVLRPFRLELAGLVHSNVVFNEY